MRSISASFLLTFGLVVAVAAAIGFCWNAITPPKFHLDNPYYLLFFFSIVTFIVHVFVSSSSDTKHSSFIRRFMAATVIKLMLYISVLAVTLILGFSQPTGLIMLFLVYYVLFTLFEVATLYRSLNK
jgi:hypothetical protein